MWCNPQFKCLFFSLLNVRFRLGRLPAWHDSPLFSVWTVWGGGAWRAVPCERPALHSSPDSIGPFGRRGGRGESRNKFHLTTFLFKLRVQKQFCLGVSVQRLPPPHRCSCMPAVTVRLGEVLTFYCFFLFLGGGRYFGCLYLSGVNFQALSSFWACSSLSLVCSSSAFILRKNKLMAGSTMDDRSWAALGCWTCFRYWIWVCRVEQAGVRIQFESDPEDPVSLLTLKM